MSCVVVIIDGAAKADYDGCEFKNKADITKENTHTPEGFKAESLSCTISMLGYPKEAIPKGRAYMEALVAGIKLNSGELILRCNGVEIKEGKLYSSCIERKPLKLSEPYSFYNMGSYKNLISIKDAAKLCSGMKTFPPHENIGGDIAHMQISCKDKSVENMLNSLPEKGFWAWGESVKSELKSFYSLHKKTAAMVCGTQIVRGIAIAADIYCPYLSSATADTDTDLCEKAEKAIKLSKEYDYVFVHINGADEAAHRKDVQEKHAFIKKIENFLIKPLISALYGKASIIITSDHATDAVSGAHSDEKVPVYIFNPNEESNLWQKYL